MLLFVERSLQSCQDFPLKAEHKPSDPCGPILSYFGDLGKSRRKIMPRCLEDATVMIIGDSRGQQLFSELLVVLDDPWYKYE